MPPSAACGLTPSIAGALIEQKRHGLKPFWRAMGAGPTTQLPSGLMPAEGAQSSTGEVRFTGQFTYSDPHRVIAFDLDGKTATNCELHGIAVPAPN